MWAHGFGLLVSKIHLERLDRAWVSVQWLDLFPSDNLRVLPRLTSDHCPILPSFCNHNSFQKIKPFKFEPMWCLEPSFEQTLNGLWCNSQKLFFEKLKDMSPLLVLWNKDVFGNIFKKKSRILVRIEGIQKSQGVNGFSENLFYLESVLQKELLSILHREELFWKMKSRDNWIVKGDKTRHFFIKLCWLGERGTTLFL